MQGRVSNRDHSIILSWHSTSYGFHSSITTYLSSLRTDDYVTYNSALFCVRLLHSPNCFDQIAKLQALDCEGPGFRWTDAFNICGIVEGKVHEIKDFGVVISFKEYSDVYGFISHYQCMIKLFSPLLFSLLKMIFRV